MYVFMAYVIEVTFENIVNKMIKRFSNTIKILKSILLKIVVYQEIRKNIIIYIVSLILYIYNFFVF